MGGVMSGGRGPVILSLLRNKEVSGAKIIINLIKSVPGLNKVREKIKTLWEMISLFI